MFLPYIHKHNIIHKHIHKIFHADCKHWYVVWCCLRRHFNVLVCICIGYIHNLHTLAVASDTSFIICSNLAVSSACRWV